MADGTCSVDGCDRPVCNIRGWCNTHYSRWLRHGDPLIKLKPGRRVGEWRTPPAERFWPKVDKDGPIPEHRPELGPCWIWTGAKVSDGYGWFFVEGDRKVYAHRWAVEDASGTIPKGLEPDHLCRVHACVKAIANEQGPAHLEVVTRRENLLRGETHTARNARKTHCKWGHPFDEANTYVTPAGTRQCRTCNKARDQLRWQRRKAAHGRKP